MPNSNDPLQAEPDMSSCPESGQNGGLLGLYSILPSSLSFLGNSLPEEPPANLEGAGLYSDDSGSNFDHSQHSPYQPAEMAYGISSWLENNPRAEFSHSASSTGSYTSVPSVPRATPPDTSRDRQSYPYLKPLLPHLQGILSPDDAAWMLEIYFKEEKPFPATSPYARPQIVHPGSVLHPISPRPTSPLLLLVVLLDVAQTADIKLFDAPGARQRITLDLYYLVLGHVGPVDMDSYMRTSGTSHLSTFVFQLAL